MQLKDFKSALPFLMKANIPALLVGHHGVGKSQGVRDYCQDEKYKFFDLRLGTQDTGDLIGLADFETDKNGNKLTTKFMPPNWLQEVVSFATKNPELYSVIFLDEINRARRDVLQAIFQLVLDKKMHTVTLPSNVYIMAAMNPNTEDYIVTDISDKALLDRFCQIKLSPSSAEWISYAKGKKFNLDLVQFIQDQPEMLQEKLVDFDLSEVKPSRRSWEAVNKLIQAETPLPILQELCYGIVGHTATSAFIASLKNSDKPIPPLEILGNYDKIRERVKSYSNEKNARIDLLNHTANDLTDYLKSKKSNFKIKQKEEENLKNFIIDIPKEVSFNFIRNTYEIDSVRNVFESEEIRDILEKTRGK